MTVKIYSWNMYRWNRQRDQVIDFIKNLEFDILCIQEVPQDFLRRLKGLPYSLAYGIEVDFIDGSTYGAILSRGKILQQAEFILPKYSQPFRTRLLMRCMYPFGWRSHINRRGHFADVEAQDATEVVRVFNLHLTPTPAQRRREFESAMRFRDGAGSTIVCGDLNVLEHPRVTLLNWLLGGRVRDIFTWRSERREIEELFAAYDLHNPLRGRHTQTISHSQLDHILVPRNAQITKAEVLQPLVGSDHHPIGVHCQFPDSHRSVTSRVEMR